jgi:hypothetical protein
MHEGDLSHDEYLARRLPRFLVLLGVMVLLIAACELLAARFPVGAPLTALRRVFFHGDTFHAVAISGAFFVYLATRPPRREIAIVAGAGLILEALRSVLLYRNHAAPDTIRYNIGVCAGLLSLGVLAARAVQHRRSPKGREALIAFITGLILPGFVAIAYTLLDLTYVTDPLVRDQHIYVVDGSLGFQPSFALGRLFEGDHGWLFKTTTSTAYNGLPAVFALMYWIDARPGYRPAVDVLVVFIVAAVIAAPLYHALPVIGPAPAFKKAFPSSPPVIDALAELKLLPGGRMWRNCMPSMHATWAMLVLWQAQPHRPLVRGLAYVFVALTFLAMLGFGYHFLADIVVSLPFAMAVRALCVENVPLRAPERLGALLGGAALTAVWFLVIRAGSRPLRATGALTWIAFALTIAVTWMLHRALARRMESARRTQENGAARVAFRGTVA